MEISKDVPLNGRRFRIDRASAFVGSWLLTRLTKRMYENMRAAADKPQPAAPQAAEDPAKPKLELTPEQQAAQAEAMATMACRDLLESLSIDEFLQVQRYCLGVCSRYEDAPGREHVAFPVLMEDGRFALADMEFDVLAVYGLTTRALAFILGPSFAAAQSQ